MNKREEEKDFGFISIENNDDDGVEFMFICSRCKNINMNMMKIMMSVLIV